MYIKNIIYISNNNFHCIFIHCNFNKDFILVVV